MSEIRKRVKNAQGEWRECVIVDIDKIVTTPTIVELADGARLTIHVTVSEAIRFDEDSKPEYGLNYNTSISVDTVEDLMRQENKNGA